MPDFSSFNFIAFYRPTRPGMVTDAPTPAEREAIAAHFQFLSDLQSRGTVWFAGRTQVNDHRTLGVCIFHADSERAARKLIDADPCLAARVMTADVIPFRVAIPTTE